MFFVHNSIQEPLASANLLGMAFVPWTSAHEKKTLARSYCAALQTATEVRLVSGSAARAVVPASTPTFVHASAVEQRFSKLLVDQVVLHA